MDQNKIAFLEFVKASDEIWKTILKELDELDNQKTEELFIFRNDHEESSMKYSRNENAMKISDMPEKEQLKLALEQSKLEEGS